MAAAEHAARSGERDEEARAHEAHGAVAAELGVRAPPRLEAEQAARAAAAAAASHSTAAAWLASAFVPKRWLVADEAPAAATKPPPPPPPRQKKAQTPTAPASEETESGSG